MAISTQVMGHMNQFLTLLSIAFFWLFCYKANGVESDVECLRSLFTSIQDPIGYLNSTWDFNNKTEGSICLFSGVDCWHPNENKVLNIKLSNMELKGSFPRGLKNCSSLTGLDLSNNQFSGTIPSDISTIVKYVTSLDLSSNGFTGEIPADISNCTYLNVLKLDHNKLSGQIPPQLSLFSRIKTFSVSNNYLTGQIPNINGTVADDYANNSGLCGKPLLPACASLSKGPSAQTIVAAAVGGVTASAVIIGAVMTFLFRRASVRRKVQDPEGNNWTKSLKGSKGVQVSLFKKSVSKMKLGDLMKATNNFSKDNIIGSGRTGAMYKAVLQDGTLMMCKRLQDSQHSEDGFKAEMTTIGGVNHQNLVPLLGFCIAKNERILLYKYMENGTLHDNLHPEEEDNARTPLVWSQRLKIAIGAARGLAWLHHNCNPRILHRNISSKCILLDGDFEAKISDFGLARLMNPVDTHLSTFVNGEFGDLGYVAPEYARTLVATPKGDVYSFGTVLLELVTSERPTQVSRAPESFKGNLVEWIAQLSNESKLDDAIDRFLMQKGVNNEIFQVLKIACNCVLPAVAKERPTMFEVYQLLRAIGERYNFSVENEAMAPTDSGGDAPWQELIVARDITTD